MDPVTERLGSFCSENIRLHLSHILKNQDIPTYTQLKALDQRALHEQLKIPDRRIDDLTATVSFARSKKNMSNVSLSLDLYRLLLMVMPV